MLVAPQRLLMLLFDDTCVSGGCRIHIIQRFLFHALFASQPGSAVATLRPRLRAGAHAAVCQTGLIRRIRLKVARDVAGVAEVALARPHLIFILFFDCLRMHLLTERLGLEDGCGRLRLQQ